MEKGAVLSRQIQDTLSGVDVVKVFSAEERETARIHNFLEDYKQFQYQANCGFYLLLRAAFAYRCSGRFSCSLVQRLGYYPWEFHTRKLHCLLRISGQALRADPDAGQHWAILPASLHHSPESLGAYGAWRRGEGKRSEA